MVLKRRRVLQALPALPLIAAGAAKAATTDVVLTCDTALAAAMNVCAEHFWQKTRVRVRVFPTAPGLVLPQLARAIQNDLVFVRRGVAEAALQADLIGPGMLQGGWLNPMVIAGRQGAAQGAQQRRIAVADPTFASDMDGPAIIRALGLTPAAILGVIDTDEAAWQVVTGRADAALLHRTDIAANPGLEVLQAVPNTVAPPIAYTAAVTKLAWRTDPHAFIVFLLTPEAGALLQAEGLEAAA